MDSDKPVTDWINQVREQQQPEAVQKLWGLYFSRLVKLARKKLNGLPRRAANEEDVALSAFHSFFRAVKEKRFPKLDHREDLWQILVMLTLRKAIKLIHYESREKRDFRKTVYDQYPEKVAESDRSLIHEVVSREPNPQLEAQVVDGLEFLLSQLTKPELEKLGDQLQEVALRKLDGYTNAEISQQMKCSVTTTERRLALIRDKWQDCLAD